MSPERSDQAEVSALQGKLGSAALLVLNVAMWALTDEKATLFCPSPHLRGFLLFVGVRKDQQAISLPSLPYNELSSVAGGHRGVPQQLMQPARCWAGKNFAFSRMSAFWELPPVRHKVLKSLGILFAQSWNRASACCARGTLGPMTKKSPQHQASVTVGDLKWL